MKNFKRRALSALLAVTLLLGTGTAVLAAANIALACIAVGRK